MNDHESESQIDIPKSSNRSRRLGFLFGIILLIGAAIYLISDPDSLKEFADKIVHAPRWAGLVVIFGPIINWICVGLCLHALMRRHGKVGRREMLALVGSAWLLNHLPMRPGLVGRIGYHAKINKIRVRDSIGASIWSMVHAAVANGIALGIVILLPADTPLIELIGYLSIPIVVFALMSFGAFQFNASQGYLILGLFFRNADLLIWMIRYAAAFTLLGFQITPMQIVIITAVSQIAQVIPITGGGLGLREWGVGIAAGMASKTTSVTMRTAVGADVINRVAETIIVIPLGIICTGLVARNWNRWNPDRDDSNVVSQDLSEDQSVRHTHSQDEPGESCE
ncbi:MAG: hypothetical protein P1U42_00685 [Phycisphaerales bacterium]|nr:hypothetical protein [Phycisphaerales bacterium]